MGSSTAFSLAIVLATSLLTGCNTGHGTSGTPGAQADATRPSMKNFALYGPAIDSKQATPERTRPGIQQVSFADEGDCTDPCVDQRGRVLAFASTQHSPTHDIYTRPLEGRTITRLTTDAAEDVMPTFSPDGRNIAFASNRSGQYDIYIVMIDGGRPTRLTSDNAHEYHPSWSADGRYIAYSRLNPRSHRNEIWVLDLQQPGRRMFVDYGSMPEWSPDPVDQVIAFQRPRERGSRLYSIWTVDFNTGEAKRPTEIVSASNAATINPTWSPDAGRIAFATVTIDSQSPDDDALDLWTVQRDGSDLQHLTIDPDDEYLPTWSTDGRLYFVSTRTGNMNIWSVTDGVTAAGTDESTRVVNVDAEEP